MLEASSRVDLDAHGRCQHTRPTGEVQLPPGPPGDAVEHLEGSAPCERNPLARPVPGKLREPDSSGPPSWLAASRASLRESELPHDDSQPTHVTWKGFLNYVHPWPSRSSASRASRVAEALGSAWRGPWWVQSTAASTRFGSRALPIPGPPKRGAWRGQSGPPSRRRATGASTLRARTRSRRWLTSVLAPMSAPAHPMPACPGRGCRRVDRKWFGRAGVFQHSGNLNQGPGRILN